MAMAMSFTVAGTGALALLFLGLQAPVEIWNNKRNSGVGGNVASRLFLMFLLTLECSIRVICSCSPIYPFAIPLLFRCVLLQCMPSTLCIKTPSTCDRAPRPLFIRERTMPSNQGLTRGWSVRRATAIPCCTSLHCNPAASERIAFDDGSLCATILRLLALRKSTTHASVQPNPRAPRPLMRLLTPVIESRT